MEFLSFLRAASTTTLLSILLSVPSYLRVGLVTTWNIVLYAVSLRRCIWLEGRVGNDGVFMNWIRHFRYAPANFVRPTTEEEILDCFTQSRRLRLFGAGHSFNDGVVSEETLLSLDDYSGLVCKYLDKNQIAVKGGTRIRKVAKLLLDEGLAFKALPSHDAQSIGGILSTDVHGTGRIFGTKEENWGFVSESVVRLKLVDGKGEIHECEPSADLFKAAIGGVGAVGIITEVVVQGVPRFNVEQKVERRYLSLEEESDKKVFDQFVEKNLRCNDHFSLYLFPFTNWCQINTWNSTHDRRSLFGDLREDVSISFDALVAAWLGNLFAYTKRLPEWSWIYKLKKRANLVLESNKAYNRTIYHQHQELEFTVPFEKTFEACQCFKKLYEKLYRQSPSRLPYTLIEVRFTPAEHDLTLIGAGRDRRSTWIDLICNDSRGYEEFYAAAEEEMKKIGARPHLGKYCKSFGKEDMEQLHGGSFEKFLNLVKEHDPHGKFANEFTRRLFGHGCS
jgi:FAD/FMN-containing dehydrogenase